MWTVVFGLFLTPLMAGEPFKVTVVDQEERSVSLVILETTHRKRFVSDNRGVIAIDEPELMDREVWFGIRSPGYQVKEDGFGYRGVRLKLTRGGSKRVVIERTGIARRLGRLTGAGLFAESQKVGNELNWKESGIAGCDSVQSVVHKGRRVWIWGDTNVARYPLGNFQSTYAWTAPGWRPGLKPPIRPSFEYALEPNRKPRGVAKMPGKGPTWLDGLASVPDAKGEPRLVAHYVKASGLVDVVESGLCVWNEEHAAFDRERVLWNKAKEGGKAPKVPGGHAVSWTDEEEKPWLLFGNPLPTLRCAATYEAWRDPAAWEHLKPQVAIPRADGSNAVIPQSGSIAWHPTRRKWVCIFVEKFGAPSFLGEVWYAEAAAPTGPWGPAIKVLSHENYSFYNPKLHIDFTPEGSSVLLFEGTYTTLFTDKAMKTPRYDYNQILYRVDLDDPALAAARGE